MNYQLVIRDIRTPSFNKLRIKCVHLCADLYVSGLYTFIHKCYVYSPRADELGLIQSIAYHLGRDPNFAQ